MARGSLDDAQSALEEARAVLGATQRERWIAHTLAGLAEVALLRGAPERWAELLRDARERYAARDDLIGVTYVEQRLRDRAKDALSLRKEAPSTNTPTPNPKGRRG